MTIELTSHIPIVRRRRRRRRAQIAAAFAAGAAAGAGVLYVVDSISGRRRRKISGDRVAGSVRRAWRRTARAGRGVRATAYGTTQRVRHRSEAPKDLDDVTLASYQAAALAPFGPIDKQRLLAAPGPDARLELLRSLLAEERDFLEVRLSMDLRDEPE